MADATKRMKAVSTAASPTDTVDIIISQPIRVSVKAAQLLLLRQPRSEPPQL